MGVSDTPIFPYMTGTLADLTDPATSRRVKPA